MKKLLTALLVVAMVLSLATVAFAADFSDTKDLGKDAQASISKLSGLEVINGYPDGTFKPGNSITRAEFAKIAAIAGGMGASADVLQGSPSQYTDVAASQWYTGYINLASSQGWVKGYPDGTFRPNSQITYAEVITVLVRLLGYNDNLPGPWPVDYIAKAGALDITEDVAFNSNAPANRADVAVMADATLDCKVVKWDNDTEDFEYKEGKLTLLDESFDSAVNDDYYVSSVEFDKDAWYIKVDFTNAKEKDLDGKKIELAENCVISNGVLPSDLGSKIVDILYNSDDEVATFIEVTSTTVKADGEDWKYDDDDEEFEIDDETYDRAKYFVGDEYGPDDEYAADGYYMAYIDADDEVYKVIRLSEDTPAIVEEYEDGELSVKYEGTYKLCDEIEDIDFEDDDVLIKKAGKYVDADELAENDVIYVEEKCGFDYYIEVAAGITAEGTLNSTRGDVASMKIDGTWYDVADYDLLSDDDGEDFEEDGITEDALEDFYDGTIRYFLNKANQVAIVITGEEGEGSSSSRIYGVVTDIVAKNSINDNLTKIKVLTADGSEVSYEIDTDEVELEYNNATDNDLNVDDFIKFAVNEDNEIDGLTILAETDGTDTAVEVIAPTIADDDYYDADNDEYIGEIIGGDDDNNRIKFEDEDGTVKWLRVNEDTVVFNGGEYIDDDAEVIDYTDLVDWADDRNDTDKAVTAYVQFNGTRVEYVYVNHDIGASTSVDYALVLDKFKKSGDTWVEIDVLGESEEYEVKNNVPEEYSIYDYSISSGKFSVSGTDEVFNAGEFADEYAEGTVSSYVYFVVDDVDRSANAVKADGVWYYADEDTVIYDYSDYYADGDDPEYRNGVRYISDGDYVVYVGTEDEVDLFVIVTNVEDFRELAE